MRRGSAVSFLAGVGVSAFGDWLTTFALAVVLYRDTGSYAATAGYFLVRVAPRPVGAWLGGPLGDLVSPRLGILGAALTQGAITAALAIPLGLDQRPLGGVRARGSVPTGGRVVAAPSPPR